MHEQLKKYLSLGLSVVPVNAETKRPHIRWEEYQARQTPPAMVQRWANRWPDCAWGIVTGKRPDQGEGLVVIDCDDEAAIRWFWRNRGWSTCAVETSRGIHLAYRHPGQYVKNGVKLWSKYDIRGDRGYVIWPPSPNRRWLPGRELGQLADLPLYPIEWSEDRQKKPTKPPQPTHYPRRHGDQLTLLDRARRYVAKESAVEGGRNHRLAMLCWGLITKIKLPAELVRQVADEWNARQCTPPMDGREVQEIVEKSLRKLAGGPN
ncbi:Hypothetical protein PBC10988_23280 [Planctomycetales bacterium 10988]|nr:Hypothetical protein PBC10988_23280 [Planctomycetales bacterium 10988]